MQNFWKAVYNIFVIPILWMILLLYSLVNKKAKKGVKGRKNLFINLETKVKTLGSAKRVWFHSSSMGEFEQAKPIIAIFKEKYPEIKIIVSFFSPSGYENNLKYKFADLITYIPFDSSSNASKFLEIVKPDLAVFMRYDVWPNFIWKLKKKNIPAFLVDATMSEDSKRKLPLVQNFHHHLFSAFTEILTVSKADANNFTDFNIQNVKISVGGDTRFDQVYNKSLNAKSKNILHSEFLKEKKIFLAGSSWKDDDEHIFPAFYKLLEYEKNLLMILVPHEPTETNLEEIEDELKSNATFIRFSSLSDYRNENVIIIDCIGLLVSLYSYGHVAYVGGGFGDGVHNVLEPAIYGIPVMFGPRNKNSQEAQELKNIGAGYEISDKTDVYKNLRKFFDDENFRSEKGKIASDYVMFNIGASKNIIEKLKKYL
jgi:3-deoxy-D-manno-octulosonic-acid transferase